MTKRIFLLLCSIALLASCRRAQEITPSTGQEVTPGAEQGQIKGFFLLNEGNMGSNKATLDYFDYQTGIYTKNIYAERNPGVVKELGDVGNDIQIYGNKLYAVINCSHFVEVMELKTAKHIAQISIPNCRYIVFKDQYAYVTSYAGPVAIDPNARLGYVAKIDTATLKVVGECTVGYQPEEMVIAGGKLYVANSGGYRVPNYDKTVSVIDLEKFTEVRKIDVAINLHRLEVDRYGNVWVSSRGDYYNTPSKTFVIDSRTDKVTLALDLPNSNMNICGDSIYVYSAQWNYITNQNTISYAIVNTQTKTIVERNFIKDGTDKSIKIPYGMAVNPKTKEIMITDAKDYVTPGTLYCFGSDGKRKWSVTTGDIPAHIVFTTTQLQPINN
ncbi:MAG: YncE family protein [Mucinivorans sp.]